MNTITLPMNNDNLIARIKADAMTFAKGKSTRVQLVKDLAIAYGIDNLGYPLTIGYKACPQHARPQYWNSLYAAIKTAGITRDGMTLQINKAHQSIDWKAKQIRKNANSEKSELATSSNSEKSELATSSNSDFSELAKPNSENQSSMLALPKPLIQQLADIIGQLSEDEKQQALSLLSATLPKRTTKRGKKAA